MISVPELRQAIVESQTLGTDVPIERKDYFSLAKSSYIQSSDQSHRWVLAGRANLFFKMLSQSLIHKGVPHTNIFI